MMIKTKKSNKQKRSENARLHIQQGDVAQRLTQLALNQKIAGSIPAIAFFIISLFKNNFLLFLKVNKV